MKTTERRRYFRVDDEMILAWCEIDKAEFAKRLKQFSQGEHNYPDPTRMYLMLEADIASLIELIDPRSPQVAQTLRLLNRKVNLLSKGPLMKAHQYSLLDESPQAVNISACGMAFMAEKELKKGADLQVELVLVPENIYMMCYGTVINCEKITKEAHAADKPYRVNVDFSAIREEDQERLIQHIMQKEITALQIKRKRV